ncbi:high affinity sulfate transporter 1 [Paenarthrobacter nitroguajacolicus]|uniref:SulP family inorganic anion transporter n=1 Tax=Paenarthrobacter TaxID=1742992 RepID=UPI00285C4703|nr:SulP family inorganic anion transporter [Paenarthrobacter nitroguajacolicus]MDR6989815.1 high affinity sulfate transporter 1 [Paenarthrobacter nitroguajacolicus]
MSAATTRPSAKDRLSGVWALKGYQREWLRHDIIAGAALFALLVPAGMAYAQAAGLPPVTGLYATVIPLLVYAVVGPSRILVLGPDSALAPLIGAAVIPLAAGGSDKIVALAGLLALLVGAIMLAGSALRLGAITGLLSKPIRLGYLNGIALLVALSQLPAFLGIEADGDIWQKLAKVTTGVITGGVNLSALLVGVGSLALIWIPRFLKWKVPGVLLAVVGSCVVTALFDLDDDLKVTGVLPQGLPMPALDGIGWVDALTLLPAAAGIALMAFADTGVLSQTLAAKEGKRVSGNREMAALGAANAATGLLGGFPISGSASRTPVAVDAGAKSQLTGVVGAALVLAFMLLAPGVTGYLPSATLAAVVIAAAIALADPAGVKRLLGMSRSESVVMLVAFLGVLTVGVLQGIVVAIALALLDFVRRAWDPYRTELGTEEGVPGYHDLERHPEGKRIPGLLILRFDAPLFFGNGHVLASFVREQLDEAPDEAADPVGHVILAAEPITGIDTTALDDLVTLDEWLASKGVDLVFAELKGPVKDTLLRLGTAARFTPDHFFPTVGAAVRALKDH